MSAPDFSQTRTGRWDGAVMCVRVGSKVGRRLVLISKG